MRHQSIIIVEPREVDDLHIALDATRVFTPDEIREALTPDENTLWIARSLPPLHEFADVGRSRYRRDLLLLEPIPKTRRILLETMFDRIIAPDDDVRLLEEEQLLDVVADDRPQDFFIGAVYDEEDRIVVLYRGTLEPMVVPLRWFQQNPVATPNPRDLEPVDYGQGVRLGDYEVATRTILYEFDADYRRRQKKNRRRLDESFGGCLRRLRRMKGLKQSDFTDLTARTIRRIEKGEVENPRPSTIERIAKELDVAPDEIETY